MLRSFRYKILLSFFAFIRIFIIWLAVYLYINHKQTRLDQFTNHLTNQQYIYSESNRDLQNFMLTGFHQNSFYTTGRQTDIDRFDSCDRAILINLQELEEEAQDNHIDISGNIDTLVQLQVQLIDSVKQLKKLYYRKGFKEYGLEGILRTHAHYLEDSCPIPKTAILMLRRREKDFMLRGGQDYRNEVDSIADALIKSYAGTPKTLNALTSYKSAFDEFAFYFQRLNIYSGDGMYANIKSIINQLDNGFRKTNVKVDKEITGLNRMFNLVLIITFIILVLASVYLSAVLSNGLTGDIKKLNNHLRVFVSSGFREDKDPVEPLNSKITELRELIGNVNYMKIALMETLGNLEATIIEEKQISTNLELTINKLNDQLDATKFLHDQFEKSETALATILNHVEKSCIFLDYEMKLITFNQHAANFIATISDKPILPGELVTEYLPEDLLLALTASFSNAIKGTANEHNFNVSYAGKMTSCLFSLFPLKDKQENTYAVLLMIKNIAV